MKSVKVISISDTHGELLQNLPSGDILTISGDICPVRGSHNPTNQMFWLKNHFLPWTDKLVKDGTFHHVVFVAGNHDFVFKKASTSTVGDFYLDLPTNVHYLQDSMVEVEGLKIYGTPWTPTFGNWAWMNSEVVLASIFEKVPMGLDILLSHGPAFGWCDCIEQFNETEHIGSKALKDCIIRTMPKWVYVGHIHSGSHIPVSIPSTFDDGIDGFKRTNIVNVAVLDENYEVVYKPFISVIVAGA